VLAAGKRVGAAGLLPAAELALVGHAHVEALLLDVEPRLGDELARELDRNPKVSCRRKASSPETVPDPARARSISSESTSRPCSRVCPKLSSSAESQSSMSSRWALSSG